MLAVTKALENWRDEALEGEKRMHMTLDMLPQTHVACTPAILQ